jgi:CheY-like chemotaxis protein
MGKKILLADDSITIQKVIELTFSDEDFDVVTVGNGRLALEKVQEVRPDIVLCDIIMPEKDGYEVCEFIKRNPALSHVPVLLLTGAFEPFDQERAARVGCDGFLAKPFEPQTLIAKVKDLLAQAASRPAPAARPMPVAPPAPPPAPAFAAAAPPPAPAAPPPAPLEESFFEADAFEVIAPAIPVEEATPAAPHEPEPEPIPVPTGAFMVPEPSAFIPEEPFEAMPVPPTLPPTPSPPAPRPVSLPVPPPAPLAAPVAPPAPAPPPVSAAERDVHEVADEIEAAPDEMIAIGVPPGGPSADEDTSTVMFRAADAAWTTEPTREVSLEDRARASVEARGDVSVFEEVFEEEPAPPAAPEPELRAVAPRAPVPPPPAPPRVSWVPAPPVEAAAGPVAAASPVSEPPAARETARPTPVAPPAGPPPAPPPPAAPAPEAAAPEEISFQDLTPAGDEEAAPAPSEAAQVAVPREMVETIAQRVVAQISERVVREVAWEVIPDLAEALIKKEIERLKAELQQA